MPAPVLIFSTAYFPLVGGAEVAMKEVTDRLPGRDFHLFCAQIRPGLPAVERIGNVTVHRCGFGRPVDKYLLPVIAPVKAFFLPGSRRAAAWALMASYGGFAALSYTWLRPKAKLLLTLQEGDPLEHYAKRTGSLGFLHAKIFKRADAVQAISRFLAEWAERMGFAGTPEIVPNGVDLPRFAAASPEGERERWRAAWGLAANDVAIVTTSRLSLKNGVDDLIRAVAQLPARFHAVIAGEGEDRDKLVALAEEKGVTARVHFLGKRGHDELPGILRASEIFCRPSLSEGLGNSFLEAMAAGLPIIGTPVGGIPDFLTDNETGVFCQPRDPASIATAATRLADDAELRARVVRQGKALAIERYGWDGIAARIGKILDRLSA